jgi:hypothetical protein
MQPTTSMDQALEQNAAKGAVMAFRLVLELPANIIKQADEIAARRAGEDDVE